MSLRHAVRRLGRAAVERAADARGGALARGDAEALAAGASRRWLATSDGKRPSPPPPPTSAAAAAARETSAAGEEKTKRPTPAHPLAGIMFPWESAVLSGERKEGPMPAWQKLYWVAFAGAVAFLVGSRAKRYYDTKLTKEEAAAELAANRAGIQRALEGRSFNDETLDPFEGMSPEEIEKFISKEAPDGDPYAGMTPGEINDYMNKAQEESIRGGKNISLPKIPPRVGA